MRTTTEILLLAFTFHLLSQCVSAQYSWTEANFPGVPVDHFSYTNADTFPLRYLYNTSHYKSGGPVFFYTGNDGPIENFAQNTGILWNLAPQFNAAVIFAEHRYYGKTMPFGVDSYKIVANLGYLTSSQAIADYAMIIPQLKESLKIDADAHVIAFGGSYGGMLAAWLRMKYPEVVHGAWSSSAPIFYFEGGNVSLGAFDAVVKRTLLREGCSNSAITDAFEAINRMAQSDAGITSLNQIFALDQTLSQLKTKDDVVWLENFIRIAFEYLAESDYPYVTSFITPMPAWPVRLACSFLSGKAEPSTDEKKALTLKSAIDVFYNYTGSSGSSYCANPANCGSTYSGSLGSPRSFGWPWQACTELVPYICAQGPPNDVLWSECSGTTFDNTKQSQCSQALNGVVSGFTNKMVRPGAVRDVYGFDLSTTSNIVFTNGILDPWSSGGPPNASNLANQGIFVYNIDGAAHHLDVREPNTCDPTPVKNARYQIVDILRCWLNGHSKCDYPKMQSDLPKFAQPTNTNCRMEEYPWGQQAGGGASTISSQVLYVTFGLLAFVFLR